MDKSYKKIKIVIVLLLVLCFMSCGGDVAVKPASKLRLEYNPQEYNTSKLDCPFNFDINNIAILNDKKDCAINIKYPKMKATVYLTYQKIKQGNLKNLLTDAQKLTYGHNIKANEIFEQPRVDTLNDVYGMYYIINGDAATQSQFYVTDSINHFVTGSLYFDAKPNFDSIYPAVVYLRDDIRKIMETILWEE